MWALSDRSSKRDNDKLTHYCRIKGAGCCVSVFLIYLFKSYGIVNLLTVKHLFLFLISSQNGQKLRQTPSRRLSQSFGLQVLAGAGGSTKTSLLSAVDEIIDTHTRHRRSLDAHFKAFISMGLK